MYFWVKKLKEKIFTYASPPPGKTLQQARIITSQAKGNYPFPSGSIFLENLFSLCGKGEVEETV